MPKVTEAHRQARRQQILMAAFTCFGRAGFHDTTMQDICEEADLSPGAVYNYFDGKDDIIRGIAEVSRDSADELFGSLDTEQSTSQVLSDLLLRLARFAEDPDDKGHSVRVRLWGEALRVSEVREIHRDLRADLMGRITRIIRRGQEEEELSQRLDPEALARLLIAFYQGMVLQKAIDPECSVTPAFEAMSMLLREATT